jgi:sigma-E factor negative regulatory protein RseB
MLARAVSTLICTGALLGVATPQVRAEESPTAGDLASQARAMRAWLVRIHEAASHRNFQGTFVVSGGGSVSSARIAHYCQGPSQFERSESLDGQARLVYRHNDVVTTLWPAARVATVEQRDPLSQFPGLLQAGDDHIADFYEVHARGVERIAGQEANVLDVRPRDAYRYGYRLWADQTSGLLLRADVLGSHHEVLETSAFSEVSIGVRPKPDTVLLPMKRLDGYRVLRPVMTPTRLEAEGWILSEPVPGFHQVNCVRRPIEGRGDLGSSGAGEPVLQAIYSDGLTYVSVFIEPFQPARHTKPLQTSVGPTQTLMRRHGDWWITVLGDVPPLTLHTFADALQRSNR